MTVIFKRRLAMLMVITTILYAFTAWVPTAVTPAMAAEDYLVNDDFEDGAVPDSYIINPNPPTADNYVEVREDPANPGNKALYLHDTAGTTSVARSFLPQTSGRLILEADFMHHEGKTNGMRIIRLQSSDNKTAVSIETNSGQFSYRRASAASHSLFYNYSADTWYKLKIVADLDRQCADIYLDGELMLTDQPFDAEVRDIAKWDSNTPGSSNRSHFLDNIKVYKNDPVTVPLPPSELRARSMDGSVELSWGAVTETTYYTVKAGTASGQYDLFYRTENAAVTSYTIEGLNNGTPYYFTVSASNSVGEGPNAAEVTATPSAAPPEPTGVSVHAGDKQIRLSWDAVAGAESYTVRSSTVSGGPYTIAASGLAETEYTYTGLLNNRTYYFVISAETNGVEGRTSEEIAASPISSKPVQAPMNLRVPPMAYDEQSIILVWEKPEEYSGIRDYRVYQDGKFIGTANENTAIHSPARRFIDKFYAEDTEQIHVPISMHNFTVTGLAPSTAYTFTVTAVDADGNESPASNPVTQTTAAVPEIFNIEDYGAVGDGETLNTAAIQAAIDDATPGGKVVIPPGVFKSGAIWLKSDMTLEISRGATLLGSEDPEDYPYGYMLYNYTTVPRFYSLINAHTYDRGTLRNIRIVGEGTIDGNGWLPPVRYDDDYFPVQPPGNNSTYEQFGVLAKNQTNYARDVLGLTQAGAYSTRSNLITLRGVENVFYGGFTALNPSNHTLVNLDSDHITVAGVKLLTFDDNNADGIEFGGGEDLVVFNNVFDTGDDSMNFAAGQGAQGQKEEPTRNAWIFNNYMREGHGGVVMGSHTAAWIENILAEDNVMDRTEVGLRAKTSTPTGGGARNIVFRDTAMRNGKNQAFIFTSSYSDVNSAIEYEPANRPSQFKGIYVHNVSVDLYAKESINVAGVDGGFHEDIHFDHVTFYRSKPANINYLRGSTFNHVVFVDLYNPWAITNSSDLEFSGMTTMNTASEDAAVPPRWPVGSQLTASAVNDTFVILTWTPAQDNVKVTGYRIFEGDTIVGVSTATGMGEAANTYTVQGLSPGLSYEFRVEAADATGNWTDAGIRLNVVTTGHKDTVPPVVPDGSRIELADKIHTTWLTIKWPEASDNIGVHKYLIYVNGELKGQSRVTSSSPGNMYTVTGLSFETPYTIEVEAVDAAGNTARYPEPLVVTTAEAYDTAAPYWPEGAELAAESVAPDSVLLRWTEAKDDLGVTGYRIYKDGKPLEGEVKFTPANQAHTVPSEVTSFKVDGLMPETEYRFRVEAGDAASKWTGSGPSATVTTSAAGEGPPDPVDPTDPPDPVDPTDPPDRVDPTDPPDPVDPTDPPDPVDPTDPLDPVDPTDPPDPSPGRDPHPIGGYWPLVTRWSDVISHFVEGDQVRVKIDPVRMKNWLSRNPEKAPNLEMGAQGDAHDITFEWSGEVVRRLTEWNADITLQLDAGFTAFSLPLKLLNDPGIAEELRTAAEDIVFTVRVNLADENFVKRLEIYLQNHGMKRESDIVQWTATASVDGRVIELRDIGMHYGHYLPIANESIEPDRSTVAQYDPAEQRLSFVPSVFLKTEVGWGADFRRIGSGFYLAISQSRSFSDMEGHWAEEDVLMLANKLIAEGIANDQFAPELPVTRAQFTEWLVRVLGLSEAGAGDEPLFKDTAPGDWFSRSVATAAKHRLVVGYEDGSFRPNQGITREEMAVLVHRAWTFADGRALSQSPVNRIPQFLDTDRINLWAIPAVQRLAESGWIEGRADGFFEPQQPASRAEAAVMLVRLLRQLDFIK
ncbi:fibronectin type III domain-containing protein [Paenibacillus sp. 32O-W]|uniref:fibronectin type III domain-containing protein n=1 Tax=Paenibacillus sp. 32O-W TaxID=1695218 RepID=UPI001642CD39|nr:fibronectin type III domain-containing protein [Paenibacillus sp. 32O-W]